MVLRASPGGTARRRGQRFSRWPSTLCWSRKRSSRQSQAQSREARLAALLHDAPEYVIGDMISPFKAVIGGDYRSVEARILRAVHIRFGLSPELSPSLVKSIKAADRAAAYLEATGLAGFGVAEGRRLFGEPQLPAQRLAPLLEPARPADVERRFLQRFAELDEGGRQPDSQKRRAVFQQICVETKSQATIRWSFNECLLDHHRPVFWGSRCRAFMSVRSRLSAKPSQEPALARLLRS